MKIQAEAEKWRIRVGPMATDAGDARGGAFLIPGPCGRNLAVIASNGNAELGVDWEHVSVSPRGKYTPTWLEMDFIKNLFWDAEETVMQLHPPRSRWINNHPGCLHMWRPKSLEIPLPPHIAVGIKGVDGDQIKAAIANA